MLSLEPLLGPFWPLLAPLIEPFLPDGAIGTLEAAQRAYQAVVLSLPLVAAGGLLVGASVRLLLRRASPGTLIALLIGVLLVAWGRSIYANSPLAVASAVPWVVAGLAGALAFAVAGVLIGWRRGL